MAGNGSKAIWFFLFLAGAGVLVFIAAARPGRDRPITVNVTHAVHQNLSAWTTGNGKVEPIDPRIIQSQLSTRIEKINVTEGQTVKAGDVLLVLDATDAKSELARTREQLAAAEQDQKTALRGGATDELAQIQSDLTKTNAEIALLTKDRDSLQRLYAAQSTTRTEIDQNRVALEKQEAEKQALEAKKNAIVERSKDQAERAGYRIDEARNAIQSLQQKIDSARVLAPVNGTIYSLPAKTGTFVHIGDTMIIMADLKRLRARAFIDEPELGSLKEGQAVEITWDALPGRIWNGIVEQLPKTIATRGSRNVGEVLCSVNNDEGTLVPETNVNVRIRTAQRENALTLTRGAVRNEGSKRFVFTIEDGRLRKREVTVGISDPAVYEILGGISEKDAVAVQLDADLHEGQPAVGSGK